METILNVAGMTCDGCERSITKALERIDAVSDASADHERGTVTVRTQDEVAREVLVAAIEDAGYDVLPDDERRLPMA